MIQNSFIQLIKERRSIRKYTAAPITKEEMDTLLDCAMFAPSAKNLQPLHFIVLEKREDLQAVQAYHPHSSMLTYAQAAILVCGDTQRNDSVEYLSLDAAAATMNILLSASSMKIGSCWLGIYPRKERMQGVASYFKLPDTVIPLTLISLGHTEEQKPLPERFDPRKIHYHAW